mmetsp:Transcript_24460/g.56328  ORF Transcript_24460/g.56328 Transcript_24460/m.56328 type:complete len:269 (-) Transcript_24460:144-950(-)
MAVCAELAHLADPYPFRWEDITNEPKVVRCCLHRLHRTMEYEILHTGGFIRLCTERGRIYWMAQNEQDHRPPDWKLHFSIQPDHVPQAWDLLSKLFVDWGCDFGMKAVSEDHLSTWPRKQWGREITVYIFVHDGSYPDGGPMMDLCDPGSEHRFWLGPEFERGSTFWWSFVHAAEALLASASIENNGGIATGDLALGGRYASLRNEAFVLGRDEEVGDGLKFIYPPNAEGWNAARHPCPLDLSSLRGRRAQVSLPLSLHCCHRRSRSL